MDMIYGILKKGNLLWALLKTLCRIHVLQSILQTRKALKTVYTSLPYMPQGSALYLNGQKLVDNNGCHGELERHSSHKFLSTGAYQLTVDMCQGVGGSGLKMRNLGCPQDQFLAPPLFATKGF